MASVHDAQARMRTADLAVAEARRLTAATKLLPRPANRAEVRDRMELLEGLVAREQRATRERGAARQRLDLALAAEGRDADRVLRVAHRLPAEARS